MQKYSTKFWQTTFSDISHWFLDIVQYLHHYDKSHLISVWLFLYITECSLSKFGWVFLHLYSSEILACILFFLQCLCLVLLSGWLWIHRMPLSMFLPLQLFWIGLVWEWYVWVILNMFGSIPLWSHLILEFHFQKV